MPLYPLLQMFSIGGTLAVIFLAYTSLFQSVSLTSTRLGQSVLAFNVCTYLARTLGEIALAPEPRSFVLGACSFMILVYADALLGSRETGPRGEIAGMAQA